MPCCVRGNSPEANCLKKSQSDFSFTRHVDATLSRWLERAGRHSERLHQQLFVNLELAYVQVDELKAPIVGDKENWLWAAIEPLTKIVTAIHVGKRSNDDAMVFSHHLVLCLAPTSHSALC